MKFTRQKRLKMNQKVETRRRTRMEKSGKIPFIFKDQLIFIFKKQKKTAS